MLFNLNILSIYQLFLYDLQQKIAFLLFFKITYINFSVLAIFFIAGILTSLTPCFISLLPLSLSYLSFSNQFKINKRFFILGLFSNLLFIIVSINFISYHYIFYLMHISFISFFVLLIISLSLLQIIDLSLVFKSIFINNNILKVNFNVNSYMMGLLIGFTTLPCSTPIIILINFCLYHADTLFFSLVFLFFYLLGCVSSFIFIFNVIINYLSTYVISFIWNIISPLMGFIILFISLLFFFEKIFI